MRLTVNGTDAAPELVRRVDAIADAMASGPAPRRYSPAHSALRLRDCRTEAEFLPAFLELAGRLTAIDAAPAATPAGTAAAALGRLRRTLWQRLGSPLDLVVARQNRANAILLDAVRFCAGRTRPPSPPPTAADPPPDAQG